MFLAGLKGTIMENQVIAFVPLGILALLIRFLLPRAIQAQSAGGRFALGTGVFITYTLMLMFTIWHLCFRTVSIEDCLIRACVAVALVNLMMLFVATLLFLTREKRPMTPEERMKLKDM